MIKHLISCIEPNEVVSIFCDIDSPSTHLTGFIENSSEEALVIRHISKEGSYDGFIMIDPCDIFRIDRGGEYEKKIQTLYLRKGQAHPSMPQGSCIYESVLRFCMDVGCVISIELADCVLSGLLVGYGENYVHLHVLDSYGRNNGESIVASSEIRSFAVDTTTERDIAMLYNERKDCLI